jgi:type I restriction enzyme S subunit
MIEALLKEPKEYGIDNECWNYVGIKDVCFFQEGPGLRVWQWKDEGIKVINIKNIIGTGEIILDNTDKYISLEELEDKYRHFEVQEGDILVAASGWTYGKVGVIKKHHLPLLMNTSVIRFRSLDENQLLNSYLYSFLSSPFMKSQIDILISGVDIPNFGPSHVKRMSIPIPPIQTQKRIADILSAYDDLIENNLKRIKLLEQASQNIYKEWFVNLRFPDHENTPINEETGLPVGWEYGVVSDLCEVKSGYAFKSKHWRKEGNPVIKIKNINNNTVNIGKSDFVDDDIAGVANKYELFSGDVIIAMTGATVGKVGLVPKIDKRIYLNQRVGLFRPLLEENNNIALVFSFFLTDDSQQQVLNFAQGAAQPNISGSEIGNIKLNIADSKVLYEFNKLTKPSIYLIQTLYGQNQKLKAARDILLPRLMNRTVEVE